MLNVSFLLFAITYYKLYNPQNEGDGFEFCVYHTVYRLEEDVSLLLEDGGRLSVWALKVCSYKTKAEA